MHFMSPEGAYDLSNAYYVGINDIPNNFDLPQVNLASAIMNGSYRINPVKTVKFDPFEEILWSVSSYGHFNGYYEWYMKLIVSIEVTKPGGSRSNHNYHNQVDQELLDLMVSERMDERLLYLLSPDEVFVYCKTGRLIDRICLPDFTKTLTCMCQDPLDTNKLLLGTESGHVLQLDVEKGAVVSERRIQSEMNSSSSSGLNVSAEQAVRKLCQWRRGVLVTTDVGGGTVVALDWRVGGGGGAGEVLVAAESSVGSVQCNFRPHLHMLRDLTVNKAGHAVVSCGTHIQHGVPVPDQYLQVFDLRYRKAQCPIKTEMKPRFVRFMPVFNDAMLIMSDFGHYQIANFGQNILGPPMEQLEVYDTFETVQTIDISSNACLIAFGTVNGLVSVASTPAARAAKTSMSAAASAGHSSPMMDRDYIPFNASSQPTAVPNYPLYMSMGPVKFDDPNFIISSSQFTKEPLETNSKKSSHSLSSDWPAHLCTKKYSKFKPVDMSLFKEYPSKFKTELIGEKPSSWGSVWFPY